jgi:hypothetical protein
MIIATLLCLAKVALGRDTSSQGNRQQPIQVQKPTAAEDQDQLRKEAQNPVASLISVPIQENFNFNISPGDRTQNVMNIQPVIPERLSAGWNVITRVIAPIVYQPIPPEPGQVPSQGVYGLGDFNPTFFISPSKPSKLIWGIGPTMILPTGTSQFLGQGKWSMGPALVLVTQPKNWTLGVLMNNVWSFAGQSSRQDVDQFLLQYFINYNLKKGYFITWQPTLTANWEVSQPYRWTVPFGGGLGRITKLGNQPVNLSLQFYGNPIRPPGTSPWGMRLQIAFLFPVKPKN